MIENDESFFDSLEKEFSANTKGKRPIPLSDFSPIHGLLQYAHDLQGEWRQFNLSSNYSNELGVAATRLLNERLRSLNPTEIDLSFVAIKSLALLDEISETKRTLFDFGGIHIAHGTPKEFIKGTLYERPTISLAFEDAGFLSAVEALEEFPDIPSDNLAVPVYSLRLE